MPDRHTPLARADFRLFRAIATRWMDNDVYGHVNNVVYYSYFDTAVNGYLVEAGLLDIVESPSSATSSRPPAPSSRRSPSRTRSRPGSQ